MTTQVGAGARASPTGMLRVDGLCDRFEAAWAGEERPRIEDFLEGLGDAEAGTAFRELLALELALRRAGGEEPSPDDYRSRFPSRAPAVDSAFEAGPIHVPTQIAADPHGATNTTFAIDGPGPIDLHPGPVPEGYELLEVIGRGGMGVVYRARQVRLNRLVALKMVSAGGYASQDALLRFLAEAESIARLRHANVVQVYDRGECEGLPFYSMEYFAAGSLSGRVDGTPWPAVAAARTLEQVSRGVAEAHRLGIIHRDLKPANILLADDGTPKVADFGLAKSLEAGSDLTRTDRVLGTPSYMAPEQAAGHTRTTSRAADLYSLGAIFYELITGRPPFRGATALETLAQVRTAEPVPPSRLVPGLARDAETIAMKCLRKEPARRYASALELAEDLRRFAAGEIIVARCAGPLEHSWKWAKRRPVMAALSAAVLLLAVGSTIAAIGIARVAVREAQARGALRHTLYVTRMNLASQAWDDANIERLRELLVPYRAGSGDEDLRGVEWYLWWDRLHSPRIHRELPGHAAEVLSLAFSRDGAIHGVRVLGAVFSPDGRTVATASCDRSIKVWDAATGELRTTLYGHAENVYAVAFSPDGTALASASLDGTVRLWRAPLVP